MVETQLQEAEVEAAAELQFQVLPEVIQQELEEQEIHLL
tara:strand:+ start:362 stop:478 length:117 start_codon:yes stop_codon:yes gene_type:complete